ncbi:MAG: DrmB family protein [Hyphomicrobiales bacterium]
MTTRAIGDVRPSQVITTFGPGAIVDLQTLSVIVAGIDRWPTDEDLAIHEPRLQRALHVNRFFSARPSEGSFFKKRGTIPTYLFPRYQVCPVCRTLSAVGEGHTEYDSKWQEIACKAPGCKGRGKHRATTLPAPFIVACPAGHIDDFPCREYVHRGVTTCRMRMQLYSVGRTGTVADLMVECECEHKTSSGSGEEETSKKTRRSASDAFGERRGDALGQCTRRRPWLGIDSQDTGACPYAADIRAMQRGATNAWFPIVRSALAVKEAATPLGIALNACNAKQIEKVDALDKLKTLIDMRMFPPLEAFPVEDVWAAILKQRGEIETDEIDLRWPEWLAFRDPASSTSDKAELFLQPGEVPEGFDGLVARVVLARKLLEVRALVGFTRIDAAGVGTDDSLRTEIAPIYRKRPDWLPAVEVRGEGIFIELDESEVTKWEARKPEVDARARAMAEKFRQWETERGTKPSPFPGARYVLLHSMAHTLIRQLSLDCGYSASSVRERIYSSTDPKRRMAGVLLYTASPDSEGSLGGLVDLGSPRRFPELFRGALRGATRCSSDPLCADHKPDVHATINGAACHACILASETSCETFNRFLDRNVLVPTMAASTLAFFPKAAAM